VNEDFAVESMAGDIFQLGNLSWRILRVQQGTVRVEDARGQPPSIPFWFGEAPARSPELSDAVSELRRTLEPLLQDPEAARRWVVKELGASDASESAALQVVEYAGEAERMLGTLPTVRTIVAERFFAEAGGMQLVIHAPFGSRVNRAWGLALRKRFCRQFNFELQAAATEDGILLSLGPQHSFPLENVFRFLQPESVADILVQALLDAPMFGTHWRWNATIALAIPRSRGGRRVPPQIQRMEADDLLAAAFPDAAACLENIPGDREIPDHPLVRQTIDDCLYEVMDLARLTTILEAIRSGGIRVVARDLPEPSPFAAEILNARPYAFLDDAPLEERRTQAVQTRRAFEPTSAGDLGALDPAAIGRVRDEAWPDVRDADELHDALLTSGFLTETEGMAGRGGTSWAPLFVELLETGRASAVKPGPHAAVLWVARERQDDLGDTKEMLRGRVGIVGPATAAELGAPLGVSQADAEAALLALEAEGVVLRGRFTPGRGESEALEWADRRLLARIHRYTLNRLRAEIEPVSSADFMRFLFAWQHVEPEHRVAGLEGLAALVGQLDGFEVPAGAWEPDVLAARCEEYDPALLDALCLSGRVAWGRRVAGGTRTAAPIRTTPIALFLREHAESWLAGRPPVPDDALGEYARAVRTVLGRRGASFFHELVAASGLLPTQVERALAELAGAGLVTSDSFAGLRALITPSARRKPPAGGVRRHATVPFGIEGAGRWAAPSAEGQRGGATEGQAAHLETWAETLLHRYGVIFRALLQHETGAPPWRELLLVYRRLEARGEIRGGRFVAGLGGEQFALPTAVTQLRAVRRGERTGALVAISAADPLNLTGIITPGERVPALARNRVLYRDGAPLLALVAGETHPLAPLDADRIEELSSMLVRRPLSPALRRHLGIRGTPAHLVENVPARRRRRPVA
jgi:ATP-dependent Lhr-like helicase